MRGAAEEQVTVAGGLHKHAPPWFKETWRQYRERADTYGVLYLDRHGRGAGYVWCLGGAACQGLIGSQYQSFKAVYYQNRAQKFCKNQVRESFPAAKPNCALYAIRDRIVWEGDFPWRVE